MKSLRSYEIVQYVQERKYCSLPELMEKFHVSSATIHRDVAALVKAGQVRKVHGGVAAAEAASSPVLSGHYRDRLVNNREVKQIIAEAAISEIRDGDIIFLDSSTTVYYLAKLLQNSNFANLTIVTNSVLIIQEFPLFPSNYFLIALGGNYDLQLNAFLGQATMRELEHLSIGKAFLSALGMTPGRIFAAFAPCAALSPLGGGRFFGVNPMCATCAVAVKIVRHLMDKSPTMPA